MFVCVGGVTFCIKCGDRCCRGFEACCSSMVECFTSLYNSSTECIGSIGKINPYVTNGLSHPYHLDKCTFIFRDIWGNISSFYFISP